jgi:hypothetical protein
MAQSGRTQYDPAVLKCKGCLCGLTWTQFSLVLAGIAATYISQAAINQALMCGLAGLLSTSDLHVGGPLQQIHDNPAMLAQAKKLLDDHNNDDSSQASVTDLHKKICDDVNAMYTPFWIGYIVLIIATAIVGATACTCCDCGGQKDGPTNPKCLLPGCGTNTVVGPILGLIGIVHLNSEYAQFLNRWAPGAFAFYFSPCLLAIPIAIFSGSQTYPSYASYQASKLATGLPAGVNAVPVGVVAKQTL